MVILALTDEARREMQFWLWLLSGGGRQRARNWKPVRLRNLTLKAVLGEIGGFMLCLVVLPFIPLVLLFKRALALLSLLGMLELAVTLAGVWLFLRLLHG